MDEGDLLAQMMDDIDPRDVAPRYISHITFKKGGSSYRIYEPEMVRRFLAFSAEFDGAHNTEYFYNLGRLISDTQLEVEYLALMVHQRLNETP